MAFEKQHCHWTIPITETAFSFQIIPRENEITVDDFATYWMNRHVKQGAPERVVRVLGGRKISAYSWTDGVDDCETIFTLQTEMVLLRIDYSTMLLSNQSNYSAERGRQAIAELLQTFAWKE